jgi:hypothetical protein
MPTYPQQLITSLCEHLGERLVTFFSIEHLKYFEEYADLNGFVADTLWKFIKTETQKTEINSVYNTQVKMRRQKRNRWFSNYESLCAEYQLSDKKNPYYKIWHDHDQLMGSVFLKLYDAADLDTVIENYKEKLNAWQQDDESLLIDYPLLQNKTKLQVKTSFQNDLIINLIEIILESYDGNIENYFSKKPDILLDKPFFASSKFSVPFKESLDSYVADLVNFDKDDTTFQMLVSSDPNDPPNGAKLRVFDPRDNQILMTLINHINLDFYESKQIILEVGTIAKAINSRPNKHLYDDIKKRLHNMGRTTFQMYKKDNPNEPVYTFSFFDNVRTIDKEGKEFISVTFGNTLYDSIAKRKMISVTSSNYNSLELELSKLLYHNLQKERIALSTSSVPDEHGYLYKTYDYSYFQRIILFKKKKKAENIQLIMETLQEFVEKQIALADFRYDKGQGLFHLYYFPLNDDERADLISTGSSKNELLTDHLQNNDGDSPDSKVKIVQTSLDFS